MEKVSEEKSKQQPGRFKVIGTFIRALKRWQSALNPTYEFGSFKDHSMEGVRTSTPALMKHASARAVSTPVLPTSASLNRSTSGRTSSGRPSQPGIHYGHKGNLLFQALPDPEKLSS